MDRVIENDSNKFQVISTLKQTVLVDDSFNPSFNQLMGLGEPKRKLSTWRVHCFKIIYLVLHFIYRVKTVPMLKRRLTSIPRTILLNINDKGSRIFSPSYVQAASLGSIRSRKTSTVRCFKHLKLFFLLQRRKFRCLFLPARNQFFRARVLWLKLLKHLPVFVPF